LIQKNSEKIGARRRYVATSDRYESNIWWAVLGLLENSNHFSTKNNSLKCFNDPEELRKKFEHADDTLLQLQLMAINWIFGGQFLGCWKIPNFFLQKITLLQF
jgi:hypothetical protein